jgi:hypothetical protein
VCLALLFGRVARLEQRAPLGLVRHAALRDRLAQACIRLFDRRADLSRDLVDAILELEGDEEPFDEFAHPGPAFGERAGVASIRSITEAIVCSESVAMRASSAVRSAACDIALRIRDSNASTRSTMSRLARDESTDSRRTSAATAANPRPDSPARAASTAALTETRLVCRDKRKTSSDRSRSSRARSAAAPTVSRAASREFASERIEPSSVLSSVSERESAAIRSSLPVSCPAAISSSVSRMVENPASSESVASRVWLRTVSRWVAHTAPASSSRARSAASRSSIRRGRGVVADRRKRSRSRARSVGRGWEGGRSAGAEPGIGKECMERIDGSSGSSVQDRKVVWNPFGDERSIRCGRRMFREVKKM